MNFFVASPRSVSRTTHSGESAGYSLLEMLIAVAILGIITAAVFDQINTIQKRSQSEAMKLDMSQQSREFLDQTVRDLHMAGYPKASMFADMPDNTDPRVAAGLVSVSPTQILMEGDVNSEGQVYSVKIAYVPNDPNDPGCPCVRRYAYAPKLPGISPLAQPMAANYTETTQVIPPGIGPGLSGEDLFAFYDMNGNPVPVDVTGGVTSDPATLASIKTIKINLSLVTNLRDPASGGLMRTSMSATARLNQ